jgi:hypothetical protein
MSQEATVSATPQDDGEQGMIQPFDGDAKSFPVNKNVDVNLIHQALVQRYASLTVQVALQAPPDHVPSESDPATLWVTPTSVDDEEVTKAIDASVMV